MTAPTVPVAAPRGGVRPGRARFRLSPVRTTGAWRPRPPRGRRPQHRPRASRARNPAAVVPPGEVTAARSASMPSPDSAMRVAAPRTVWRVSWSASVAGQSGVDPGLHEGLGHEEDVGRPRARQAGDGSSSASRGPAPPCRPPRGSTRPRPGRPRRHRGRRRWRPPPGPPVPGCWAWPAPPAHRRRPRPGAGARHPGGDRQHPAHSDHGRGHEGRRGVGGLGGQHHPCGRHRLHEDAHPGEGGLELGPRRAGGDSTTARSAGSCHEAARRPPRRASAMRPPPMNCSAITAPRLPARGAPDVRRGCPRHTGESDESDIMCRIRPTLRRRGGGSRRSRRG